ncbi:LysR family transcriptional regulator [Nitrogeniibacter mangrovi]|uniref:LysR family transcriptional regulator n=1 Tax=Nitrogeniibacter mangrovi TaxID=2016596 RepID=A0A6C1B5G8_9RHOO|nr:LysR family transcriptional regulator [Nitrogeniibacter mangrovi]QID17540.1 LysR family transcriptional regulator [Nitrogeniibacter mangrovi]
MKTTLRQLEVFFEVARLGRVSDAAKSLSMSQSAASAALGELERQFDVRLFDRIGRSVRLNALGEQLLPMAAELLARVREVETLLGGEREPGHLRVGATLTIGNYLATLIVADYLQRFPSARADLHVHNTARIVERLLAYELDIGLIEGACNHADLEVEHWVADELVVFCAPGHPLAGRTDVDLSALAGADWILREPGSGTRSTFEHAMRHVWPTLNIRLELEHTEAIKRAVEAGLGLGCISRLALRDAFRRGSLVPVEVPALDLKRAFSFVWHRHKFRTPGMQRFIALCRGMTEGVARSDEIALAPVP